jgi:Tfp pilus assembly protein PilV
MCKNTFAWRKNTMPPRQGVRMRNSAGFTMLELTAAFCVAIVVVALIMLSLATMTRQTLVQKHKVAFQTHSGLAASAVADEMRQGSQVIAFDRSAVTFVGAAGDTITYRFLKDSLTRNGKSPGSAFDSIRVAGFTVEVEDTSAGQREATFVLTLGTRDRNGATQQIQNRVRTKYVPQDTVAVSPPQ